MTDKEFQTKLRRTARAFNKALEMQEEIEAEYERRYGHNPSDINDDVWIDAVTAQSGRCSEHVTLKIIDESARFALSLL